jgi:hypothetical protein
MVASIADYNGAYEDKGGLSIGVPSRRCKTVLYLRMVSWAPLWKTRLKDGLGSDVSQDPLGNPKRKV